MDHSSNNDWRKLTAVIYRKPQDSKIFGSVELDVTEVETFVSQHRKNGLKITLTHVFMLAVARALKEAAPEINCYVRRGNIIQRKSVDVTLSVLGSDRQMTSVKVLGAEYLSLQELSQNLQNEVNLARKEVSGKVKSNLARLPWPFRQWIANLFKLITIGWGIKLPFLGVSADTFGSFVLSNLGSVGLDVGYPALAPFSNVAMVLIQGRVNTKPWVVDGQVLPRRIITLSAALDHRVVDASHAGVLFNYIRRILKNPEILEQNPASTT